MALSKKTRTIMEKNWFFNNQYHQNSTVKGAYLEHSIRIVDKCKKLLTLMHDENTQKTLYSIIDHTEHLLRISAAMGEHPDEESLNVLLKNCQDLQGCALKLPNDLPNDKSQDLLSYKIAIACFYLLAISICLTVGATFGAWYFGYLTAKYFTDTLVGCLAFLGIPATCLGLLSFGLYQNQDLSQDDCATLVDDVGDLCDTVIVDYRLASVEVAPEITPYEYSLN